MLPQLYKFSYGLCLNNFHQIWLIGNERNQVPPFIYVNRADEISYLVMGRKALGYMKYLMRSYK